MRPGCAEVEKSKRLQGKPRFRYVGYFLFPHPVVRLPREGLFSGLYMVSPCLIAEKRNQDCI